MTETVLIPQLIATIYSAVPQSAGPTKFVAEVLEVSLVDAGGNEYGRAKTKRGAERIIKRFRVKLTPQAIRVGMIGTIDEIEFHPDFSLDCGIWIA